MHPGRGMRSRRQQQIAWDNMRRGKLIGCAFVLKPRADDIDYDAVIDAAQIGKHTGNAQRAVACGVSATDVTSYVAQRQTKKVPIDLKIQLVE